MWRTAVLFALGCSFRHGTRPLTDAVDPEGTVVDAPAIDAPPDAPAPPIRFWQGAATFTNNGTTINLMFPMAQLNQSLNVVIVGWVNTHTVMSVTDGTGNTYKHAGDANFMGMHQSIYYSCSVAGTATNTVHVTLSSADAFDVEIAEYTGVAKNACLDQIGSGSGNAVTNDSGSVTTTQGHELLLAANNTFRTTTAADPAFTSRGIDQWGNVVEDQEVFATGTYHAIATQDMTGDWVMSIVTFKGM